MSRVSTKAEMQLRQNILDILYYKASLYDTKLIQEERIEKLIYMIIEIDIITLTSIYKKAPFWRF